MKKSELSKFLTTIITISLFAGLLVSTLSTTIAQPISFTKKTYAFIGALPNPVGVNQEVLLHLGITDMLGVATDG